MALRKIREAVSSLLYGSSWVASPMKSLWRGEERPEVDRSDYEKLYKENPFAQFAVDMAVSDSVGLGFFTTVKKDYRAKEIVDKFCEDVNLDELLSWVTRDMLITGDGFLERIYDKPDVRRKVKIEDQEAEVICPAEGSKFVGLKWLPPTTMLINRTATGRVRWYTQKVDYQSIHFSPDKIIDFKWNPVGLTPYGTSILSSVYNLLKDLDKIRENFVTITRRYAKPNIIWMSKGLSRAQMEELKREVEASAEVGQDLYINTDLVEPKVIEIDARGRFENYYSQLVNAAVTGLQTPTLISLQQATLASSRAMLEFYAKKIERIRRIVKRKVEREIFRPIIKQAGLSEVPRLRWRSIPSKIDDRITLVFKLVQSGILDVWGAAQLLSKWGIELPEKRGEEVG